MDFSSLIKPHRITNGRTFKLAKHPTRSPSSESSNKKQAKVYLQEAIAELTPVAGQALCP